MNSTSLARYISLHIFVILFSILSSKSYKNLKSFLFSQTLTIFSASLIEPLPPLAKESQISKLYPKSSTYFFTYSISFFVSVLNLFKHTTILLVYLLTFSICVFKLIIPSFM